MLTQVQQPYLGFESTEIINSMQRKLQCCTLCLLGYKKLLWLIQSISYLQKTLVLAEVPTWGLRYQGWQTYGTHSQNGTQKDFHGARHSLLSQFSLISLPDQRVYILKNTCIYTHTYLTVYTLYMNYRYYQIKLQWNILTQIGSSAKCWLDIYHWGAGLEVSGSIQDIGKKVSQSPFQTGSSSSPSHFQIFFLIAFLEEALITNII